jgi:NADH-quinone oxidoreductase subunit M
VVATSGVVLAAAYMLWMFRRVFFGPVDNEENRSLIDLDLREKLVMLAMVIPIFWVGLYPEALLRRIEPTVIELIERVEQGSRAARAAESEVALAEPEPASLELRP